ncbi:hypothetical protein M408DRAFT_9040 [Serendipita vermifera MAFF 305830]|uniref:Uncharacterized protein n=1 Tax=Serendipita vermifera MAFF 305830 TaxID=933852 RepID=A0A0C3B6L2_SERVB|nr:hypothetical protein M408DRAFT_9040 [Serendipita vermifera MAFF 305830]
MSYTALYRPPPPAPSAFLAMQLAQSTVVSNAHSSSSSTPSAYLPRIASKTSLNMASGGALPPIAAGVVQNTPASRNNSASSITALPSLSSSLNNLHTATSIGDVEIVGTQTPEAEELLRRVIQGNVKRLSNSSMGPVQGSNGHERTFNQYSDDSESDEDGDEDEDGYFRHQIRRSDQSRQNHHQHYSHSGAGASPQSNRHSNKASAGRSGLVMNRSRKDRLSSGASATSFAF